MKKKVWAQSMVFMEKGKGNDWENFGLRERDHHYKKKKERKK